MLNSRKRSGVVAPAKKHDASYSTRFGRKVTHRVSPDPAAKAIIMPPVAPRSRANNINIRSQKAVNDEVEESRYASTSDYHELDFDPVPNEKYEVGLLRAREKLDLGSLAPSSVPTFPTNIIKYVHAKDYLICVFIFFMRQESKVDGRRRL